MAPDAKKAVPRSASDRLRKTLLSTTALKLYFILLYLLVGIVFFMLVEAKRCESDGCSDNCEVLIFFQEAARMLNETGELLCEERWTFIDSLYFIVTTTSTVGYGDFYPHSTVSALFTFFYMIGGLPVFALTCDLLMKTSRRIGVLIAATRKRLWPKALPAPPSLPSVRASSAGSDTESDPDKHLEAALKSTVTSTRHHFFCWQLMPFAIFAYLEFILCNCLWALGFFYLQPAWREYHVAKYGQTIGTLSTYFSCLWHCQVTATTIGYNSGPVETPGFRQPGAQGARLFATFHILFAVAYFSYIFDRLMTMFRKHHADLREARMLQREADPELIATLDADGVGGVTKLEYVTGMLQLLEVVEPNLVIRLQKRFDQLDANGDGTLSVEDLTSSAEAMRLKLQEWRAENENVAAVIAVHETIDEAAEAAEAVEEAASL